MYICFDILPQHVTTLEHIDVDNITHRAHHPLVFSSETVYVIS